MTVIFDFPEAHTLSSYLRANGIYSVVRANLIAPELDAANTAIVTSENASFIPKLKNEHENLRVIYLGKDNTASIFCDMRACDIEDLVRAFPPPENLIFTEGIALDASEKNAEISGKTIHLTSAELNVLRCVSLNVGPMSAALLSELALGKSDTRILMTHVSNINKKSRAVFGTKIISSDKANGYSIVS